MSATFKIAKKKYTQSDLRRLLNEQKNKIKNSIEERIDSPLAKYNDVGQLTCILCKSIVRTASIWKVHVNSKQHKENVASAIQVKGHSEISFKRPANIPLPPSCQKKRLKIASSSEETVLQLNKRQTLDSTDANGFFEISVGQKLKGVSRLERISQTDNDSAFNIGKDEKIPEGFFDDPVKDARVRNQEYKDTQDEEWEKFQREIREESTLSNAIIAEEQDEATAERQIKEIDEQIRKWSRVLDLEKRKDIATKLKTESLDKIKAMESEHDSDDGGDYDIDEFFDWRAKRSDRRK